MDKIKYIKNTATLNNEKAELKDFDEKVLKEVLSFHKTLPSYKPTPLVNLTNLANHLNIKNIYLKDESKRFSLNAFKVLGVSYAMGKLIAKKLNMQISDLPYEKMISDEIKQKLGEVTFITATDGNHGRGVAWVANKLKQKAIILMPKGSSQERFENIKNEGAKVSIEELGYDDCVRKADELSKKHGYIMVQDTAWQGYEEIPLWIMQGYCTILNEAFGEISSTNLPNPTHIFLQAGVGSFAGAMEAFVANHFKDKKPTTIICEPKGADCIYRSFVQNNGLPYNITGELNTIMAGLSCGEPNTLSYEILRDYSDFSISCDDEISAYGMRVLSSPVGNDLRVVSGESGAVGLGLLVAILKNKQKYANLVKDLKINENSVVLLISTEGDTDTLSYENIVWNGAYGLIHKG